MFRTLAVTNFPIFGNTQSHQRTHPVLDYWALRLTRFKLKPVDDKKAHVDGETAAKIKMRHALASFGTAIAECIVKREC